MILVIENLLIDKDKLRLVKNLVQQLPADVNIGKKGVYDGVIDEIRRRLKHKPVLKIRILKNIIRQQNIDRFKLAEIVAKLTNTILLEVRGNTFVICKHDISNKDLDQLISNLYKELNTIRKSKRKVRVKG